jgi:hypothetical protein
MFRFFRRTVRRSAPTSFRSRFRPCLEALEARDTPSTTSLTVSPNPAPVGQTITLTATITETTGDQVQPGAGLFTAGKVTFFDGGNQIGSPVNVTPKRGTTNQGTAQLTTSLALGNHSLTASYSGDSDITTMGSADTAASNSGAVLEVVNLAMNPAQAMDVTAQAPVTARKNLPGGQVLVTVTNESVQTIQGPLFLVFTHLPKKVHVKGAAGMTQTHSPFLEDEVTLLPSGFVNFLVSFSGTGGRRVHFTTEVLAGAGPD